MITLSLALPLATHRSRLPWIVSDSAAIAWRILIRVFRSPEELASSTSTPVIFLLLFRYVFGGAINVGHVGYTNYIIAGIFVQTVAITGLAAGTGIAQDLHSGLIDRFRSLPIAQSAVLSGRVVATLVRSVLTLGIVAVVGLVVGFRPDPEPMEWLAALGILLLFGLAISWIGVAVGLFVRNVEAVQNVTMTLVFPLTFLSSAFVPPQTMPAILRIFVVNQPMTQVVDSVRGLLLANASPSAETASVVWCLAIVIVFAPLAVFAYGRATAR